MERERESDHGERKIERERRFTESMRQDIEGDRERETYRERESRRDGGNALHTFRSNFTTVNQSTMRSLLEKTVSHHPTPKPHPHTHTHTQKHTNRQPNFPGGMAPPMGQ